MAAASHADASHGSEPRTAGGSSSFEEVPPGAVQKYWTPNIGCNIRISLATGIPEYDEYVKSISWATRRGLRNCGGDGRVGYFGSQARKYPKAILPQMIKLRPDSVPLYPGHWAGDAACEKGGKNQAGKGRGPGGKGRGQPKGKAYLVGEQPLFFSLRDPGEEGAAFMVQDGNLVQSEKGDETPMEAGRTELDDKRKEPAVYASTVDWEYIPAPFVNEDPDRERLLEKATDPTPEQIGDRIPEQVVIDVPREKIEEFRVPSLTMVIPKNLSEMKVRQLQEECDRWGIQTSGRKDEILKRLQNLYNGQPVHKKGCSTRFVRLLLGPVPAGRPGTSKDAIPTEKSDNETKKVAGTFRARGAVGSDNATASRPTTSHGYASAGPPSGQSRGPVKPGRSPTEDEKHPGPAFSPDGQQFDPKTGTIIPKTIKFNQPCPSIRCGADGHPMVLRRGFNLFFGCSSFPTCQFTRTLQEGLAHHSASKGG